MKKSLIIRWAIIAVIIIGWTSSMFPIKDQDFLAKFNKLSAKQVKKYDKSRQELQEKGTLEEVRKQLEEIKDKNSKEFKKLQTQYSETVKANTFDELQKRIETIKAEDEDISHFRLLERAAQGGENENSIRLSDYVKVPSYKDASNAIVLRYIRIKTAGRLILGLDLQGGTEFIVGFNKDDLKRGEEATEIRDRIRAILENRLNKLGVTEPEIKTAGETAISIRMPAVNEGDKADIRKTIKDTAKLEFHLVAENNATLVNQYYQAVEEGRTFEVPADLIRKEIVEEHDGRETTQIVFIKKAAERVRGEDVTRARPDMDQYGQWSIALEFNQRGAIAFGEVTSENVGRQLAIVLDGRVYSAPNLREAITGGRAQITGQFSYEDAKRLSVIISSGNVPVTIEINSEFGTDPTLGADAVKSGALAGLVGLGLVVIFMIWYYHLAGVIAVIALIVNTLLVLGSMSITHATITMPGIAGMVLTIGMAVDANVLIFERIREELQKNKSLANSIKSGYERAFSSIFDSNLTTLITSFFLYTFGSGSIKGFAVTLAFGIFASMFTAIFMTRAIFDVLIMKDLIKSLPMRSLEFLKDPKIDFIKLCKPATKISLVMVIGSFIVFAVKGKSMLGIDFAGGTQLMYKVEKVAPPVDQVRSFMADLGYEDNLRIGYKTGQGGDEMLEIVLPLNADNDKAQGNLDSEQLRQKLNEKFADASFAEGETRVVGGHVGAQFRKDAFWSAFWSIVGVIVYLAFRFELMYGLAAVIAVIHDVIVSAGIFMLFGGRLTPTVVAALMTIIGYSLNDTIVIFDRIRETQSLDDSIEYSDLINQSLNQTLSRTAMTSLTTSLATIALLVIAGGDVWDFALVTFYGIITGTYSTIFIASDFINIWHKKALKREEGKSLQKAKAR
jgi:SecD/SecF fusion protein